MYFHEGIVQGVESVQHYFADLHIHIGRTASGKPVKISGSKHLTLTNILKVATNKKGMDMIGIIDCHVPEILEEIEQLLNTSACYERVAGGLQFEHLTLLLGSEIEVYDEHCKGPIHVLVFLPTVAHMKSFSSWLASRMKNSTLSSQRLYETGRELQNVVKQLDGLFIPAHVFTPFKSVYGKGVNTSISEVFDPDKIDAIELGLSSDTTMADQMKELHRYTYVTNSDAHSLDKIAREYQIIQIKNPTFEEFKLALHNKDGRKLYANYGLNPKLGKYYRTTCQICLSQKMDHNSTCVQCGSSKWIKGVSERLSELKNSDTLVKRRPPYIHQVPLEYIPGIGSKTMQKLRNAFQTEMNILHNVSFEELSAVIPTKIARMILQARNGKLMIETGGGGKFGRIKQR